MPDALSRRADYRPTAEDRERNLTQALPTFAESNELFDGITSTEQKLRAVQRHREIDEEQLIQEDDLSQGLVEDPVILPIREDMLAVICRQCAHPTLTGSRCSLWDNLHG
jgi:hypothetical protein